MGRPAAPQVITVQVPAAANGRGQLFGDLHVTAAHGERAEETVPAAIRRAMWSSGWSPT